MSGEETIKLAEFGGEWLKPEMVKDYPLVLIPVGCGVADNSGSRQPYLKVEVEGVEYKLRLNKTNIKVLQTNGLTELKEAVGKTLQINLMTVNNPATNQPCDSFIIKAIK